MCHIQLIEVVVRNERTEVVGSRFRIFSHRTCGDIAECMVVREGVITSFLFKGAVLRLRWTDNKFSMDFALKGRICRRTLVLLLLIF